MTFQKSKGLDFHSLIFSHSLETQDFYLIAQSFSSEMFLFHNIFFSFALHIKQIINKYGMNNECSTTKPSKN